MIRRTVMHGTLAAIAGVSLFAAFELATAPATVRPGHTAYVDASCADGVTAHADIYTAGADITVTVDGASAFKHVAPDGGQLHVPNPDPTIAHTWTVDITAPDWAPFHTSGEIPPCQKPTTTTVAPTSSTSTTSTPPSSTSTTSSVAQSSTTAPEAPTSSTAATSSTTAATSSPSTTPASSVPATDSSQPASTNSASSTTPSTPPAATLPGTR